MFNIILQLGVTLTSKNWCCTRSVNVKNGWTLERCGTTRRFGGSNNIL